MFSKQACKTTKVKETYITSVMGSLKHQQMISFYTDQYWTQTNNMLHVLAKVSLTFLQIPKTTFLYVWNINKPHNPFAVFICKKS